MILSRSNSIITPGSADLEFRRKNHLAVFLTKWVPECPKLNSSLVIDHRRRKTITLWNNSGKRVLHGITVCLVSKISATVLWPGSFQTVSRQWPIWSRVQVLVFFYRHSTRSGWLHRRAFQHICDERELGIFLVPGEHSLPEAVHCLCALSNFFKMVPINDSFWK